LTLQVEIKSRIAGWDRSNPLSLCISLNAKPLQWVLL